MGRNKTLGIKKHLYKKLKQNSPVPTWVVVRTKRQVRTNSKKRAWRRTSLKVR